MTAPKGRPPAVRDKIRAGMLADRLEKHVEGKLELTASQVRAAEILLRKIVPDLAAITHKGDADQPVVHAVTWLPPTDR